jgi:PPM family protein phosphatase
VWEQVQYGILSPEEARTHPRRHVLSRSLGQDLIISVDVLSMDIQPGDFLIQCSDGIHALLSDAQILELLQTGQPDAACRALVRQAREAGGDDNLSVQVAAVVSCAPSPPRPWWRFGR